MTTQQARADLRLAQACGLRPVEGQPGLLFGTNLAIEDFAARVRMGGADQPLWRRLLTPFLFGVALSFGVSQFFAAQELKARLNPVVSGKQAVEQSLEAPPGHGTGNERGSRGQPDAQEPPQGQQQASPARPHPDPEFRVERAVGQRRAHFVEPSMHSSIVPEMGRQPPQSRSPRAMSFSSLSISFASARRAHSRSAGLSALIARVA